MSWRNVLLWLGAGLLAGMVAGALLGCVGGMLEPPGGEPVGRILLGGAIGGLGAALAFMFVGFPLFLVTVLAWVVLVRVVPSLEASAASVALGLSVPVAFVSSGFFLAFPEEPQAGCFVTALSLGVLVAPRFLLPRLRPGAFAAR